MKFLTTLLFSLVLVASPRGVSSEDNDVVSAIPASSLSPNDINTHRTSIFQHLSNDFKGFKPVGRPLIGVPTQDMFTSMFGKTVAISSDSGNRMIVGAPTHGFATPSADDSTVNRDGGGVFLYDFNAKLQSWELIWFLPGFKGEALGSSLSISGDGSRVAIRRRRGGVTDFVEIFEIQDDQVTRLGAPIGCIGGGSGLALAPSGRRVAVSCETFDNERGRVEVYDYDSGVWISNGIFEGQAPGDLFGWSTSFSTDGNRLAISAPSYSLAKKRKRCGMIQVYEEKRNKSWLQVGGNLIGYDEYDLFGLSMDLSGDGRTVVGSSPGNDSNGRRSGAVKAFFDFRGLWLQTGSDILGKDAGDEFGEAVSISDNGARLAVSSPKHGGSSGHIRLFDLHLGDWKQHGEDITGLEEGTRLGYGRLGISLDGKGEKLAYGSPFCGLTGCVHVVGYSREPHHSVEVDTRTYEANGVDKLDWDIVFGGAAVKFNQEEPATVELNYEIHARNNAVTLYESNCMVPIPRSLVLVQVATQTLSSKKESLLVDMDINLEKLSESSIYTEPESGQGILSVCVRVDLFDEEMQSVVFDERRLSVFLDTSTNLEVLDVQLDEEEESMDVEASVDYEVEACQCDESLACIDFPIYPDEDTMICIATKMDAVRVASIQQLQFFKGSLSQTAVHNGDEDDLTMVTFHENKVVVRTRLVSAFFEDEESLGIHARGMCTLTFKQSGDSTGGSRGLSDVSNGRVSTRSGFELDLRTQKTVESSGSTSFKWSSTFVLVASLASFFIV